MNVADANVVSLTRSVVDSNAKLRVRILLRNGRALCSAVRVQTRTSVALKRRTMERVASTLCHYVCDCAAGASKLSGGRIPNDSYVTVHTRNIRLKTLTGNGNVIDFLTIKEKI